MPNYGWKNQKQYLNLYKTITKQVTNKQTKNKRTKNKQTFTFFIKSGQDKQKLKWNEINK